MSPVRYIGDDSILEGVFEPDLAKLLAVSTLDMRENWKAGICEALKKAYENEPRFVYIVAPAIPIGDQTINAVARMNNAGNVLTQTSTDAEKERIKQDKELLEKIKQLSLKPLAQENPRKRTILNVALEWGCPWAVVERECIEKPLV